jgi:hypothetical protein
MSEQHADHVRQWIIHQHDSHVDLWIVEQFIRKCMAQGLNEDEAFAALDARLRRIERE